MKKLKSNDYLDNYIDDAYGKLQRKIDGAYRHAYEEAWQAQEEYWENVTSRIQKEYKAYQEGAYTQQEWEMWVRNQYARGDRLSSKAGAIADGLAKTGQIAADYVNGVTPQIFAEAANWSAFDIEKGMRSGISFDLLNGDALRKMMTGNQLEFKARWKTLYADPKEIYKWNFDRLQTALYQSLIRGEGIQKVADKVLQITGSSRNTAVRNARTAMGSARNAGTMATYERAQAMGIEIQKEWLAFKDERTRDSHAELDGVRVGLDEEFPNGLQYPCDPKGAPAEVYNCRCTIIRAKVKNEPRTDHTPESYNKWKEEKEAENAKNEFTSELNEGIIKAREVAKEQPTMNNMFKNAYFKTGGMTPQEYALLKKAEVLKSQENNRQILRERLGNGTYKNQIRPQRQNQHIQGTKERKIREENDAKQAKTPSSFFLDSVDSNELIRKAQGTGQIMFKDSMAVEYVSLKEPIGWVYNLGEEQYKLSSRLKIEYSAKGIHGYPVKDW